jgi:hypothetical protein
MRWSTSLSGQWAAHATGSFLVAAVLWALPASFREPRRDVAALRDQAAQVFSPAEVVRELDGLVKDEEWRANAVRFVEMHEASGAAWSPPPAGQALNAGALPFEFVPLRLIHARFQSGSLPVGRCELHGYVGGEAEPRWRSTEPRKLVAGPFSEREGTFDLALSCRPEGLCLFGCSPRVARKSLDVAAASGSVEVGEGTRYELEVHDTAPDARSGLDANRRRPKVWVAPSAVEQLAPLAGRVSYRGLDATDYVRLAPSARRTAALLCAKSKLLDAARAFREDDETPIGRFVWNSRCLAVSVARWDGILFEVVAGTLDRELDYEVMALSAASKPELALISWFVGKRVMSDPAVGKTELESLSRELVEAFGVSLEDAAQRRLSGDATGQAFGRTLAEVVKSP